MSQTDTVLVGDNVTLAMPTILPKSWICTNLGRVIEYGKVDKAEPNNISDNTWVLELADIEKDSSAIIQRLSFHDRQSKSTKNKFKKGDVLYSKLRPYLNKVIVADSSGVCTTEIIPLSCGANLNNRYLFYWLKHPTFLAYVDAVGYGVNMPRLGTKDGIAAPFILAPLAEQQQIATKLDELLAQVDVIKTRLDTIPKILKRFRQSVLAAAVSGELTEDWRTEHDSVEWSQVRINDITSKVGSGATPKGGESVYKIEGVPLIRSMNVVFFGFKRQGMAFLDSSQAHDLRNAEVQASDVLLNITGASIGRVTIAPQDMEGARVNQHVCIIRPKPEILSEFLCWFFAAPEMQRIIDAENYGVTRQALTKQQILNFEISLPSIEEQTEIVAQVEQLFAFADQVEQRVKDARKRVNRLTQSILAKAFSGELTATWRAQNPDLISGENSVEALLAKIKAEREALAKNQPTKPRTIKKTGESMKPKNIMPIIEALKATGQPLSSQDLLIQAGYPGDADTDQLETFFLDIREQLNAKTITRERKGDKEFFAIAE